MCPHTHSIHLRVLLSSLSSLDPDAPSQRIVLEGKPPDPHRSTPGCLFAQWGPEVQDRCRLNFLNPCKEEMTLRTFLSAIFRI